MPHIKRRKWRRSHKTESQSRESTIIWFSSTRNFMFHVYSSKIWVELGHQDLSSWENNLEWLTIAIPSLSFEPWRWVVRVHNSNEWGFSSIFSAFYFRFPHCWLWSDENRLLKRFAWHKENKSLFYMKSSCEVDNQFTLQIHSIPTE